MIKIQNIYYMLSYAFGVLQQEGYQTVTNEEFDHVGDLLAAILAKGIAHQIKRGLGREYSSCSEPLSSLSGKIDVTATIKQQTLRRKQLVCSFDVFSENVYLNQILKTTTFVLLGSSEIATRQKKALRKVMLYFAEVDVLNPRQIKWSGITYHRNNATYKMLIHVCYMVIQGLLLTETTGSTKLGRFLNDQKMHSLFQKFVLEYYRKHYPNCKASGAYIPWDVGDGASDWLPVMKTDITLEYKGRTLIIDTKYYSRTMQMNSLYNNRTLHSNNLYQIYTYVKNRDTTHSGNVSGLLLYAKTDEEITPNHDYTLGGNRIGVRSLDLNTDFTEIAKQLDRIANTIFS
ncbi:5-methylcytosine-specific restriction endonuclease system specificity protein McrC [Gorillibacterium sp. CAU 1737]|uniref:5-methylcytosine-specific restriction endonuclease system specificity protein McrC n=1 Tax=Gorillibacterium sp. CAU 1737 TaxID=3140362 RepID=UPI003261ADF4